MAGFINASYPSVAGIAVLIDQPAESTDHHVMGVLMKPADLIKCVKPCLGVRLRKSGFQPSDASSLACTATWGAASEKPRRG